jgi:hypothetical protein
LWLAPPRENISHPALGFGRIAVDIFIWEITSQRRKKQPTKPPNLSSTRTPIAPTKPSILLPSRPLILPLIKLLFRSILRTPTPLFTTLTRRKHKVTIRKQRAQKEQVIEVKKVVTYQNKRSGRTVYYKSRD